MSQPDYLTKIYSEIFEDDKRGVAILEDLINKFGKEPYVAGGLEGARQTDYNAGQNSVVQHIVRKINQARGVTQNETIEIAPPI